MDGLQEIKNQIKMLKKKLKLLESSGAGWNYCNLCQHGWKQRKSEKPERCPNCFNRNWDRTEDNRFKYNLGELEINQSKTIPWNILPNGNMNNQKNYRIQRAVDSYSCRTGRKFRKEPDYTGLKITRIS